MVRSEQRRDIDSVALLHGDPRHKRALSPYALPLGPGSYLGTGMKGRSGAKPKPGTQGSTRGSSSFSSPERRHTGEKDLPDVSDVLARDAKGWNSCGFYTSRASRSVSSSSFWESGSASHPTQATGGLLRMAQTSRTPAFDTMYDAKHSGMDMKRDVTASPMRYSGAFRSQQMRLAHKPTARSNDSRRRSESACMGESGRALGPGFYGSAMTMDGRSISPGGSLSPEPLSRSVTSMRGGTGNMFSPGFRGPVSGRNTSMSMRNEHSFDSNYGSPVKIRSYSSMGQI